MTTYRDAQALYLAAGWTAPLPLPPGAKHPPPEGTTGRAAPDPSGEQLADWCNGHPYAGGNLALRLPDGVVGIDVDAHGDKPGAASLASLEARLGALPPTWSSSARPWPSGIRFYRVPLGRAWRDPGPGIEVIHRGWRYAAVWPSVHPNGAEYHWRTPTGAAIFSGCPRWDSLPWLPEAWVRELEAGELTAHVDVDVSESEWLALMSRAPYAGSCWRMRESTARHVDQLRSGSSRHDDMLRGVRAVVGLATDGHKGIGQELAELRGAFLEVTTDRSTWGEWDRALTGAIRKAGASTLFAAPPCRCDEPVTPAQESPARLEEQFWTARPILAHIEQFARARRASPWGVLGVVLVRVCTAVPPFVVLPPQIGSTASLNLFVGLVGPSGSGKDAAARAAEDAVPVGHIDTAGIGSGEGIAHQYVTYRRPKKDEPGGLEQYRTALLLTASEIDTLTALHGRQGSTLLPELRKAWTGDALGFAYVDKEKRLTLERHAYRLCLLTGIQPERAAAVLNDADGGTPQRFVWLPATDPELPDNPPDELYPWTDWKLPQWGAFFGAGGQIVMEVCEAARAVIDAAHVARMRGDGDALDGHALLCRLKVAAVLGIMDGHNYVDDEDWRLAGVVMAKSEQTRARVVTVLSERQRLTNRARGEADAERSVIVSEVTGEAAVKRVTRTLVRKLTSDWISRSDLRRTIAYEDRGQFDVALGQLLEGGLIESAEVARGVQYRAKS